jgi:hypothetical protein
MTLAGAVVVVVGGTVVVVVVVVGGGAALVKIDPVASLDALAPAEFRAVTLK